MAQSPGFLERGFNGSTGSVGERCEHHGPFLFGGSPGYLSLIRLVCFLCTACLLTPNTSAIRVQDHPATKAFSTCAASSASSVRLRATTASRPSRGSSGPPIRVFVFLSMRQY